MTTEEMVDFDYWRQVRKGKSRQRFFHYRWDRAFEVWTKETTEELIDVASILERVDSDGWVLLSITEQHHYEMCRDWKWRQLEEKYFFVIVNKVNKASYLAQCNTNN